MHKKQDHGASQKLISDSKQTSMNLLNKQLELLEQKQKEGYSLANEDDLQDDHEIYRILMNTERDKVANANKKRKIGDEERALSSSGLNASVVAMMSGNGDDESEDGGSDSSDSGSDSDSDRGRDSSSKKKRKKEKKEKKKEKKRAKKEKKKEKKAAKKAAKKEKKEKKDKGGGVNDSSSSDSSPCLD